MDYVDMAHQQRSILNHLRDMFSSTFDEDLIESVLVQRNWNVDRALDDLMAMANGCVFNLPVENFDSCAEDIESAVGITDVVSDASQNCIGEDTNMRFEDVDDDVKNESEDDVIVLNEEEYCVSAESDSDDDQVPCESDTKVSTDTKVSADTINTVRPTYASMAQKPATENATRVKPPDIVFSGYTSYDRIKRTRDSLERIKMYVRNNFKVMVILRGCSGSGKTTLAKKILIDCGITRNPYCYVHSADHYFQLNRRGEYFFEKSKLGEAHSWNQVNTLHVVREGLTPVIIDNTHSQVWEMQSYVKMAVCAGYEIEVVEPDTPWAFNVVQLAAKTLHTPRDKIRAMLDRYEHNVSASSLMKHFNMEYAVGNRPPQLGVVALTNLELISFFQNIYETIHRVPTIKPKPKKIKKEKKALKLTKAEKKRQKKEQKRQAALMKSQSACEDLGNEGSNGSSENVSSDNSLQKYVTNEILMSFASTNLEKEEEEEDSESDDSWSTVDEEEESSENDEIKSDTTDADSDNEKTEEEGSSPSSHESDANTDEFLQSDAVDEEPRQSDDAEKACALHDTVRPIVVGQLEDTTGDESRSGTEADSVNTMVGRFKNPMNLDANEASVETIEGRQFKFSNQLYDALAEDRPRLSCFRFHGNEPHSEELKFLLENAVDAHSEEPNCLLENAVDAAVPVALLTGALTEAGVQQILNNALDVATEVLPVSAASILEHEKLASPSPIDRCSVSEAAVTEEEIHRDKDVSFGPEWLTGFGCDSSRENVELSENVTSADTEDTVLNSAVSQDGLTTSSNTSLILDSFDSLLGNSLLQDTRVENETKSEPTCEHPAAASAICVNGISTIAGKESPSRANVAVRIAADSKFKLDAVNVDDDKKPKMCNVEGQRGDADSHSLFGADVPCNNRVCDNIDDVLSSFKTRDDVTDISSSLIKNVIENDLWGGGRENTPPKEGGLGGSGSGSGALDANALELELDLSDDNSAGGNSDSKSTSSSFDELPLTDVHNTLNRFVNNDIKRDHRVAERKKANVDRDKKNRNNITDEGGAPENVCWTPEAVVPELNTLKERILISGLDKLFNQSQNANVADDSGDSNNVEAGANPDPPPEPKQSNLLARKSAFPMIDNNLKSNNNSVKKGETVIENDLSCGSESHPSDDADTPDRVESKLWNQWMRGEGWDDNSQGKEPTDSKRNDAEPKPPRTHWDSPSKQKNTETTNIRLVNDIRAADSGVKMATLSPGDTKKNKNEDSSQRLPPKSTNFQSASELLKQYRSLEGAALLEYKENRSSPLALNTMLRLPSKEEDIESDFGAKSKSLRLTDVLDEYESLQQQRKIQQQQLNRTYPSLFKRLDAASHFFDDPLPKADNVADSSWSTDGAATKTAAARAGEDSNSLFDGVLLQRRNFKSKKNVDDKTSELVDDFVQRWKIIAKDENTYTSACTAEPDKSVSKWSPINMTAAADEASPPPPLDFMWQSDEAAARCATSPEGQRTTAEGAVGESSELRSGNFFIPVEVLNLERNKATNTGMEDSSRFDVYRTTQCREINRRDASDDEYVYIEQKYKCDKSTMTEGSVYTVKAKPRREDLANMFPPLMADAILDLYEKCNGNMDWILEILMEDGYSPSDDQLEYLSSLQNVVAEEAPGQALHQSAAPKEKDKSSPEKKKTKSRNSRNGRRSNTQPGDEMESTGKAKVGSSKWKKFDDVANGTNVCCEDTSPDDRSDEVAEDYVELFLDWSTVSQLIEYYGNPTVYSIRDYQPSIKLPVSLARQVHAYLIENMIDQAEKNENLINQLAEEEELLSIQMQNADAVKFTPKDVIEVENTLSDILDPIIIETRFETVNGVQECVHEAASPNRNENSFSSKLSLNLLLRAFPTIDPTFVKSTFKSQNFSYYDTKKLLNQYGKEVSVDVPQDGPSENNLLETEDNDVQQLFDDLSHSADTRAEVLQQVTQQRNNATLNYYQWQKFHEKLRVALQEKKFGVAAYYRDIMNAFKRKYEQSNAQAAAVLITSSCLQNTDMIDLHFFKVAEALKALDLFLDQHISRLHASGRSKATLYIITGRGARSPDGVSHLQPPIKNRLRRRNINFEIEANNTGLVKAVIRRNSLMSTDL